MSTLPAGTAVTGAAAELPPVLAAVSRGAEEGAVEFAALEAAGVAVDHGRIVRPQ